MHVDRPILQVFLILLVMFSYLNVYTFARIECIRSIQQCLLICCIIILNTKAGGPGFDSRWLSWVFFSSSWLTNVDGMKDLWCSSTVRLLSTQT